MRARVLLPLFAAAVLAGCATSGPRFERVALSPSAEADPWEAGNRRLFAFNEGADRVLVRPATGVYRTVVPAAARRGVSNAYGTLGEPLNFVNALMQGKVKSAFRAADRLLVNGILGLGVADHATDLGLDEQPHDFGQTMAVWGVPSGPFVIMPFFGPSTARDGIGFIVDFFGDPTRFAERRLLSAAANWAELGVDVLDTRSGLMDRGEQLLVGAADPYATTRAGWLQLRRYQLFDGAPPDLEDWDAEPSEALPPSPAPGPDGAPVPATPAAPDPAPARPPSG
jgi:phospholipid-binding lipoprotein MlaA